MNSNQPNKALCISIGGSGILPLGIPNLGGLSQVPDFTPPN